MLSLQIEQVVEQRNLTHAQAAQKTGLFQAGLSDLLRGGFNDFTIDQLSQVLTGLKQYLQK